METLIAPIAASLLCDEIKALPSETLLESRGNFEVYICYAHQIPTVLLEIGRLREETFRAVGEGTGKTLDIDEFDQYYLNLFIWDKEAKRIVGGYRMGPGQQIYENGIESFYINSLFEIDPKAYATLKQSIELGRSYIVQAYQRAYLPFFLLWRGILCFLIQNPEYRYLIGPVSISKYYSGVSKSMIVTFVKRYFYDNKMAKNFKPRTPYQPEIHQVELDQMIANIQGSRLKDLEGFLNTIEPEHLKVPVLLKQYTRLNAKFISFNIDPNFSDALDGLMLLDLQQLPIEILELLNEK